MFPWDPSQMSRRRSAYSTESSTATAYLVTVYFTTIYSKAEKTDSNESNDCVNAL